MCACVCFSLLLILWYTPLLLVCSSELFILRSTAFICWKLHLCNLAVGSKTYRARVKARDNSNKISEVENEMFCDLNYEVIYYVTYFLSLRILRYLVYRGKQVKCLNNVCVHISASKYLINCSTSWSSEKRLTLWCESVSKCL